MLRGRVLLVDDQPSILASYSRALAHAGFEVTEASGGDEAFRRLESAPFDVVLTDLLVPKISGLAFLEKLHAFSPELPVIVMFDKQNNEIAVEARSWEPCSRSSSPSVPLCSIERSAMQCA